MSTPDNRTRSAAERLIGLDSVTYGDERERAVLMEASTFGMTIGMIVSLSVALVAAVLGALALPAVLVLVTAVPSWALSWYAGRKSVDTEELAFRGGPRDRFATLLIVFGGVLLVVAAMAFTIFTGHGLVQLPELDVIGPDASGIGASLVKGGAIGGLGGLVVGFFVLLRTQRRKARTASDDIDDEDE